MISFGFTILKFFEYLQSSQGDLSHQFHAERARHLGLALLSLGTLILIPAIIQNYNLMRKLSISEGKSPWTLSLIVAILVGSLGLLAFLSSIFQWMF